MIAESVISLQPLMRRHLERTRAWANDPELMRLMDRARPVTEREHEGWFAALPDQTDRRYFAIEEGRERQHVGNVWLWQIDARHRKAEVRIVIGQEVHQCRGLGTQALELACEQAFGSLGLRRLYAYVLAVNPRARRAFEKAGFALEGTLRDDRALGDGFCDTFVLGRISAGPQAT